MSKLHLPTFDRPKAAARRDRVNPRNSGGSRKWYSIANAAGDEATVKIYREIGSWYGVSANDFVSEFDRITASTIHVRINSPGGDVFEALPIHNAIKRHDANVIVHIDGLAASAASFIAVAGDEVRIAANAFFMIHNCWTIAIGGASEFRELADFMDKINTTIAGMYARKSGKTAAEFAKLMDAESWLTADESIELGLADSVDDEDDVPADAAQNKFDLSLFSRVPAALKASGKDDTREGDRPREPKTKRELEKVLRDGGLSNTEARRVAASSTLPGHRDDATGSTNDPATALRDEGNRAKSISAVSELLKLMRS